MTDPACPELVIVCNVEIKATTLFQYIHSTLRQSRDPSRQSINGDQLQRRRVSARDGAIILYLKWSIAAELLVTPLGELNDQLFIESPTFGTVDQEYELKILLNTHTMCYNLLITKSPFASYYDVQLRMSGIFKQTIASTKDHELDGVVWIEWKPGNISTSAITR
ncbi:Cytoplasmic dynein intermediate chain [Trichuris trichiura]|uniref:Cytoplasmic dynein intermediate chain n=1 Tax=Trichuris trichiura TaxID=36087 RepID=A0A077Z061_TRITR|nr:Cytoplasmic dynein intermediate chain [Trichuris trichiura]